MTLLYALTNKVMTYDDNPDKSINNSIIEDINGILSIELFIYLSILKVKDYKAFTEVKNSIDTGITILIDNLNNIEISYKQGIIEYLNHIQEQNKINNHSESVEDYQTIISMIDFFK